MVQGDGVAGEEDSPEEGVPLEVAEPLEAGS